MGVKKGWRDGKLDRRRRTPVQPESAMRGRGVKIGREGRIYPEKEFDVVSVAVWMG